MKTEQCDTDLDGRTEAVSGKEGRVVSLNILVPFGLFPALPTAGFHFFYSKSEVQKKEKKKEKKGP